MTASNELTIPQLSERFSLPIVDIHIIRDACCKGATIGQLGLFLYQCKRLNLDPMLKQAYWINGAFVIGIDGFRAKAEETGEYKGSLPAQWLNKDGKWLDEWIEDKPPVAARVAVMREGFDQPTIVTCKFSSYNKPTSESWRRMPEHMLAKCAEAGAIRKAFPIVFGGVYSSDEIRGGKVIQNEDENGTLEQTGPATRENPSKTIDAVEDEAEPSDPTPKEMIAYMQSRPTMTLLRDYGRAMKPVYEQFSEADRERVNNEYKRLMGLFAEGGT